jgi:hypothetical protein
MQIMNSPRATKLGAGVMADLRAAVQLQDEKAANGSDAFMRNDRVWEERKERDDKDRKEQAKIADLADDANNGSQLSTKPDQYGMSEQNYSDLNNDLKSRDGQERFMSILRLMYPNMTDKEIKDYTRDAQVIAAVRSGQGTAEQKRDYDAMGAERRDDVSKKMESVQRYNPKQTIASDANVENTDGSIQGSLAQANVAYGDSAPVGVAPTPQPPVSVARQFDTSNARNDALSLSPGFNKVAVGTTSEKPAELEAVPVPKIAAATVDVNLAMM